jgi:benzoyl-CoA reductase/2-hydroxyglutaryl-CoA dehydratase subunit BcrC/BadD/HgdB
MQFNHPFVLRKGRTVTSALQKEDDTKKMLSQMQEEFQKKLETGKKARETTLGPFSNNDIFPKES